MGLRNFLNRRSQPAEVEPPHAAMDAPVAPASLTPEQLADLDAARAELLQVAAQAGVTSLNACPRDGSRWQGDAKTIRTITAVIREAHLEEQLSPENEGPAR